MNWYAYTGNDPVNNIDVTGESTVALWGTRALGVSVGALPIPGARVLAAAIIASTLTGDTPSSDLANGSSDDAGNESVTDRSNTTETKEDVDGFVGELDGVSSPDAETGREDIRTLNPGVSVDDLLPNAPGESQDNGRKATSEGGNIGTHTSSNQWGRNQWGRTRLIRYKVVPSGDTTQQVTVMVN